LIFLINQQNQYPLLIFLFFDCLSNDERFAHGNFAAYQRQADCTCG